jgi:hypothetical protein
MNTAPGPLALIAEDEPVLARTLSRMLAQAWPELRLAARGDIAHAGDAAAQLRSVQSIAAPACCWASAPQPRPTT